MTLGLGVVYKSYVPKIGTAVLCFTRGLGQEKIRCLLSLRAREVRKLKDQSRRINLDPHHQGGKK